MIRSCTCTPVTLNTCSLGESLGTYLKCNCLIEYFGFHLFIQSDIIQAPRKTQLISSCFPRFLRSRIKCPNEFLLLFRYFKSIERCIERYEIYFKSFKSIERCQESSKYMWHLKLPLKLIICFLASPDFNYEK